MDTPSPAETEMDDWDDLPDEDENDDNSLPDYYGCHACGSTTSKKTPYNECPKCGAIMEEEWF